jgi:nitrite reductase/ring-hydroxylating ferredoxin subunit
MSSTHVSARPSSPIERVVRAIETAAAIDRISEAIRPSAQRMIGDGRLRDVLTGRFLGHPLHPAGVVVPMTCWLGGTLVDVLAGPHGAPVAQRLIGLGTLSAAPVALSGTADWLDTNGAEQRVGTIHAMANDAAFTMFALSWLQRRRGRRASGIALAITGSAVTGAAAFLGGHLAYRRGVGVDTTAFQSGPESWHELSIDPDARVAPSHVAEGKVGALSFAVIGREREQPPDVMESRCTHRGGPLHEGTADASCIECPWHGSRFDRRTGAVVAGPASSPQPVYDVRVDDGAVMIRRDEDGGLRRNPIGAQAAG